MSNRMTMANVNRITNRLKLEKDSNAVLIATPDTDQISIEVITATYGSAFFIDLTALELFEEADIVLREETQVLDAVLEVSNTLYTHTESIARINFAIYAAAL